MDEAPTPREALDALERLEGIVELHPAIARADYRTVRDFVQHHGGCHEKEAGFVLTIEELLEQVPPLEADEEEF